MKVKNTYLRGELLRFLHTVYPDGIPEQVIVHSFYEYNKQTEIIAALEYLCEKKYIEKKETTHPYKELDAVRWFKITARGIDLIEKNIPKDLGVYLA